MADLATRFSELTSMKYVDQAKWFLNGFWKEGAQEEAENIWKYTNKFIELDAKKKAEGCELDEFEAHKFLESLGETLTVVALRERLRKIDLDCNGKMALLEYLTFKYGKEVKAVVDAPQGENEEEIKEASAKLEAVQQALAEVQRQLVEQTAALEAQKKALDESKRKADAASRALNEQKRTAEQATKALEAQRAAEEIVRKAEAELKSAIDDLKRQEENYQNQIKTLESKSQDPNASTVSKNKAAAELAQLKQEDPMPLRKAKITQEAALRKVEKERKAQEAATAKAEQAANEAEGAKRAAEEAAIQADHAAREAESMTEALEIQTRKVEDAVRETESAYHDAVAYLEDVKKKGGVAYGSIWYMERELKEAQKYLPKKKQQQL